MKINFVSLPKELEAGLHEVAPLLSLTVCADGLPVTVSFGNTLSVSLFGGKGEIIVPDRNRFYRAIGLFCEHASKENSFSYTETTPFRTVGVMIDASRNAVMTPAAIKDLMRYLAIMGYNLVMMYTEDTYEVKGYPHFGYLRGRYTYDEMKDCDDFANQFGIEMMPCIQVLAHMKQFLGWKEARKYRDTEEIMLAGSEDTYTLIRDMLKAACAPFRCKRVHIGMDEAWELGRGRYLDINGYRPRFKILCEHLSRVCEITEELGLRPMMWSDMFFQVCAKPGGGYYAEDTVISDEVKALIPKNIDLVCWHYGEHVGCDGYMIEKHHGLNRHTLFAGGMWTWTGHYPELIYAIENARNSITACREGGVDEFLMTVWGNDGHECDPFASLLGFQYTAELCYHTNPDDEFVRSRFAACTGGNFDAFMDMAQYHNRFDEGETYSNFHKRFAGKMLMWNDPMEGIADKSFIDRPLSDHYAKYAARFDMYRKNNTTRFCALYNQAYHVFNLLAHKAYLAEHLVPAYLAGDRDFLSKAANELFPQLLDDFTKLQKIDREMWYSDRKVFGWATQDVRYGGMRSRIETASVRLNGYLLGEISTLPELDAERLPKGYNAFMAYGQIARAGIQ